MKPYLSIEQLCIEAANFAQQESAHQEPSLYGVTDGKRVGTYFEHKFQAYLRNNYEYVEGSSAKGIDFPELNVDMKVTSIKQPQSSCPFKSARQKVFGLGYSLIVFTYEKHDDPISQTGQLDIKHTTFVESTHTADFQTTTGLLNILRNDGNLDDVFAFLVERNLPVDEVQGIQLAEEIIANPPEIGYLTISNALQWRLQYRRIIQVAGTVAGVRKLV